MQTVTLLSEVETSTGCFGYSAIRDLIGRRERLTLWFIRDSDGYTHNAIIVPAGEVR